MDRDPIEATEQQHGNVPVEAFGTVRVLGPEGALPQAASRLDPWLPLQPHEMEIEVDRLCFDSTSYRQMIEASAGDGDRLGATISETVAHSGKMYNRVTGSGGILTGSVRAVGDAFRSPPVVGARIVTLASLTLTPLHLSGVGPVDLRTPQVPVTGTAYLPWTASWAAYPNDLPHDAALAALDVCGAASQTRALLEDDTRTVVVLGGGHAGLLALAAVRESVGPQATTALFDVDERVCLRARSAGLCDRAITADLRDAVSALDAAQRAGIPRADLTVVVVNASDCEAAAILLTADEGSVLFFSMATSFTKAALGSEGVSSGARMIVGSGFAPDRGTYALNLLRNNSRLMEAFTSSSSITS